MLRSQKRALAAATVAAALALPGPAAAQRVPIGFEDVSVVEGLVAPTSLTVGPDGRIYVTEQSGRAVIVEDGEILPAAFLEVPVNPEGERGLMSLTFDRDFAQNGFVYAYYTRADEPFNRLSRFRIDPRRPDRVDGSETVLLDGVRASKFHNGGAVVARRDQTLLIGTGDAQEPQDAGSLQSLNGKVLRIDTQGGIPSNNPYVDDPNARDEIWAYGLRNPFGMAFEEASGRVFLNDVGRATHEEVNDLGAGGDYGWPICEGPCGQPPRRDPLYFYNHSEGCAITGGTFYEARQFPREYSGAYFFADYCGGWIRVRFPEHRIENFAVETVPNVVDVGVAPDGGLLYLNYTTGELRQIRYIGDGNRTPTAAAVASPAVGEPPLTVTFDASSSTDPDGDPLNYSWSFGDGSTPGQGVVVSHQYTVKGPYQVVLSVTDTSQVSDDDRLTIMVGTPPEPSILAPAPGATFEWGDRIELSGEAIDAEDGPVLEERLDWTVVLHHHREDDEHHHAHPFLSVRGVAATSFELADESHAAGDFLWFRVHLTASDTDGLLGETTVDLMPR